MSKKKTVNVVGLVRLVPRGGRWYAHYTTPAGRERESLKVTNLRVATEKAKEIDELLQAGQHELLRRRRTQYRHAFVIG